MATGNGVQSPPLQHKQSHSYRGGVCKVAALISSDWGVRTTTVPNGNVNIAVCLLDGGQTLLPPPTPFFLLQNIILQNNSIWKPFCKDCTINLFLV